MNGTIRDYDVEAEAYIDYMQKDRDLSRLKSISMRTFVSDYALYWWDYLGGYDVVLTQIGNNASFTQEIALTRGAATMQNKTWGAILTWKYDEPPYLDSGKEIYNQMHMAYQAGAKYIILFDYPQIGDNPYGVLTEEHFDALQHFWNDIMLTPNSTKPQMQASAVLVLPKNYGWGMRHPQDRIWLWGPDDKCPQIWDISRKLLEQYGTSLDIVYDDPNFPIDGQVREYLLLEPNPNLKKIAKQKKKPKNRPVRAFLERIPSFTLTSTVYSSSIFPTEKFQSFNSTSISLNWLTTASLYSCAVCPIFCSFSEILTVSGKIYTSHKNQVQR